jgi:hypothetical protein
MLALIIHKIYTVMQGKNMSEIPKEYRPLPKKSFMSAEWLGRGGILPGVWPRYQGYRVDLPEQGPTTLYPLRQDNFGAILPHIYAEQMRQNENDDLSYLHRTVNYMYDDLEEYEDLDRATQNFRSLIKKLKKEPYSDEPDLARSVKEVFGRYKDIREAKRSKVAWGLSKVINEKELYIVASDLEKDFDENQPLKAARITKIINYRHGSEMWYELVVSSKSGREGLLPVSFAVPTGVCAPAEKSKS